MWSRRVCFCIVIILVFLAADSEAKRRKFHSKRGHDRRKVRSHEDCRVHEEFVKCGPEPHCEMSCSNLFSPPNCMTNDILNERCWYPKCVCKKGFVRHENGHCVREWHCDEYKEAGVFPPIEKRRNFPFIFGHPKQNNFW